MNNGILIGYGIVIPSVSIFNPFLLIKKFNIELDGIDNEMLEELSEEDILEVLTFSEELHLNSILSNIASESNILVSRPFPFSDGVALYFPAQMAWEVSDSLRRISEQDIRDEITYLLKPLLNDDKQLELVEQGIQSLFVPIVL